jgi:hypothetical protein
VGRELEIDPTKLRDMADRARRLAGEGCDDLTRNRLERAAEEYDQRAREIEMDDTTGQ